MIGEILTFPVHGDKTGSLIALEKGADFPFEIKRVYYIWGVELLPGAAPSEALWRLVRSVR